MAEKTSPIEAIDDFLTDLFSRREPAPPPPPPPGPIPVVEHALSSPPYPDMVPESPARHQQEVRVIGLDSAAGVAAREAIVTFRTRCNFYCLWARPAAAPAVNDGVWVQIATSPPAIPSGAQGADLPGPMWLPADGSPLILHGAEQTIGLTIDSTVDVQVVVTANTNVPVPRQ